MALACGLPRRRVRLRIGPDDELLQGRGELPRLPGAALKFCAIPTRETKRSALASKHPPKKDLLHRQVVAVALTVQVGLLCRFCQEEIYRAGHVGIHPVEVDADIACNDMYFHAISDFAKSARALPDVISVD